VAREKKEKKQFAKSAKGKLVGAGEKGTMGVGCYLKKGEGNLSTGKPSRGDGWAGQGTGTCQR